jgi:hypothetical protein
MKNNVYSPLILLAVSTILMAISVVFKSTLVLAGVTGLVIGWFLCIDKLISASQLSLSAKILFAGVVVGLPVFVSVVIG